MRRAPLVLALIAASLPLLPSPGAAQDFDPNYLATYSIIARDPATGEMGMGVQSKAFGAGNRAVLAQGGVAVIAHQASANPMYGVIGMELLGRGYTPEEALAMMLGSDEGRDSRQVVILDIQGRSAGWSGPSTSDWKGHSCGVDYCAQGNILTGPEVVEAMARSFESSTGPLAERLLAALDAAQEAGGDARGMQSGAVQVVLPRVNGGFSDRVVDIRVDDHREPLVELRRLLNMVRSGQLIAEGNRALNGGDPETALRVLSQARDLSPENDNAWVALANLRLRGGDRTGALEALTRAIELNPGNRRQLPRNTNFESLRSDPEFLRLTGG